MEIKGRMPRGSGRKACRVLRIRPRRHGVAIVWLADGRRWGACWSFLPAQRRRMTE